MLPSSSRRTTGRLAAALAVLVAGCSPRAQGAEGGTGATDEAPEPVAVTVFTDAVELFVEYPRLLPGMPARYLAHVTVLATGEPVRSGTLRIEFLQGGAVVKVLEAPKPERDGLFIPVGAPDAPGQYTARIVVESPQVRDTILLDAVTVHPDLASARAAAAADAGEDPADAVPFLLEAQWKIGMRMQVVGRHSLTRRLQVAGEVEAPRHAMAVVSASIGGRLLPPPGGALPSLGERVEAGQVLGLIEPPLTRGDLAQLDATAATQAGLEVDVLTQELDVKAKALDVDKALLQSKAQLEFARLALARLEGLRARDLGTVADLEAARRDVEVALCDHEGSQALQVSLAESRQQLATLRERLAAVLAESRAGTRLRRPLVAPIAGEIVTAAHVEGEEIESLAEIYRVVDLRRAWIAAHVSEFDLPTLGAAPGALLQFAAWPDRTFDAVGALAGRVVHVGRLVDPDTRTVTLRYEVDNPDGALRVGMFADVFLETARAEHAVAVPRAAIVQDGGRPVAFVLVHGELFQKRVLEVGIRDGDLVEVRGGIAEGERVVTHGAYLVKLAAASPASFGAGHAH